MLANQQNVLPERPDLLSHLAQLQQMGLNPDELLLTGIWSDGVPFNSDRSQTLETISLNIFGDDSARLPLTAFPNKFLRKKKTFERIRFCWEVCSPAVDMMGSHSRTLIAIEESWPTRALASKPAWLNSEQTGLATRMS